MKVLIFLAFTVLSFFIFLEFPLCSKIYCFFFFSFSSFFLTHIISLCLTSHLIFVTKINTCHYLLLTTYWYLLSQKVSFIYLFFSTPEESNTTIQHHFKKSIRNERSFFLSQYTVERHYLVIASSSLSSVHS